MLRRQNMDEKELIKISKYFDILCKHTSMIAKVKLSKNQI